MMIIRLLHKSINREMKETISMVVGPLQVALDEAIKAQQGLQLEVAQLTLKMEDLKEEHMEHVRDVSLMPTQVQAGIIK